MGRSNCTADLGVLDGQVEGRPPSSPSSSAHSATAPSSTTRRQIAVWSPSGPTGSAGVSVELEPGDRAGHVRASATSSAAGALDDERAEALLGARRDQHPVGGVAVEHDRLGAREPPAPGLAAGPGADAVDHVAVARPRRARPCPGWRPTPATPAGRRGRGRRAARVASTAEDRNGPGQRPRPISSEHDHHLEQAPARAAVRPRARAGRVHPRSTSCCQTAVGDTAGRRRVMART